MNTISFKNFTPFRHNFKFLDASHLFPFDTIQLNNVFYHISQLESHLIYTVKGTSQMTINDKTITSKPGTLSFIPPNTAVTYTESDDYEYLRVQFQIIDLETNEDVTFFDHICILFEETPLEIINIMHRIVKKFPLSSPTDELSVTMDFYDLFLNIIREKYNHEDNHSVNTNISTVVNHIRTNCFCRETTKDYAKLAGLSESYFRTLFKQELGISPIDFRNHCRIEHAKKLLCDSVYTNEHVATYVGFDDPNYFARIFKQLTGYTPQTYRHKFSSPNYYRTHSRKEYKKLKPGTPYN